MNRIVSTPDTCGGEPRVDGTRITVRSILGALSNANACASVRRNYPDLTDLAICTAIKHAQDALSAAKPEKVTVGWRVYCVERGKRLYCLVPGDTCDGVGHDGRFDCGCYTRKRSEAYLFATREDAEQEAALWGAGEVVRVTRKVRLEESRR